MRHDLTDASVHLLLRHAALGAALTSVVLWASAFVGIRAAGHSLTPGSLSLGRLLVALLVLGITWAIRREQTPERGDLRAVGPALVVCGVLWFGVYNLALNAAERRLDAGTAAMIVYISPVLIAILAGIILGEGFPRELLAGCAIAFAGVSLIALASSSRAPATVGVLLALVAALTLASGAVTQKIVVRRLSGLQTITICCAIGVLMLAPFGVTLLAELRRAPTSAVLWTVYLGVFPTAVGFLTWAYALARTDAGRLGAMTYLVPAVSVLLALLLLGETPPALALLGGALCLAGVVLSRGVPLRSVRVEESRAVTRGVQSACRPESSPAARQP